MMLNRLPGVALLLSFFMASCGGKSTTSANDDDNVDDVNNMSEEEQPGSSGGPGPISCDESMPVGVDGGALEECEDGTVHRPVASTCVPRVPRAEVCDTGDPDEDECTTDADCTEKPNGRCRDPGGFLGGRCGCWYGCTTDADCSENSICNCGTDGGTCILTANCKIDSDCEAGQLCALVKHQCGNSWATCVSDDSECRSDRDCQMSQENNADVSGGERICIASMGRTSCAQRALCE